MDDAFDAVYESYVRAVHAYLVRLTGNRWTAEELCQETFVRYLRHRESLRNSNGALGSWLFRVATNLAFDYRRKKRPDALEFEPATRSEDSAAAAEAKDLEAFLRSEIDKLPDELRAAFLLRAHHELTFPRMAEVLSVSERTAKERFRRARDALAGRLAPLFREDHS